MEKKGFTLIELLATLVILAIIALISIPLILNVIDGDKRGGAESGALGYIEATENQIAFSKVGANEEIADAVYTVAELAAKGVTVKGDAPTEGWVSIENGQVSDYSLKVRGYVIDYDSATNKAKASGNNAVRQKPAN